MKKFLGAMLLILPAHGAIIIDGFTASRHDRFANNAAFIANGFDMSGVGRLSSTANPAGIFPWATMLSDNVFIAASHTVPGGTATFYPGNDPGATAVTRTVMSTMIIGGSDITLGVLSSPLPATIANYSYETQTISSITGANVEGANAYLSGVSPSTGEPYGATTGVTNHSVGRNLIGGYTAGLSVAGRPTDVISAINNLSGDTSPPFPQLFTADEALQQSGDSGAPLLVDDGAGGLRIIGITSGLGTVGSGATLRSVSFYGYLGNHSPAIDAFITANAVPEPSSLACLTLSLLLLKRRR